MGYVLVFVTTLCAIAWLVTYSTKTASVGYPCLGLALVLSVVVVLMGIGGAIDWVLQ